MIQHHYTDDSGFKAINSQRSWVFKAAKPPGEHPIGAYFTTLPPGTSKLATRLRLPKRKVEFVFCFTNVGDLVPIDGDRGEFIFYSPIDYRVDRSRQRASGPSGAIQ
jgi:hypothetical protein